MNMPIIAILFLLLFSINTDCLGMNMNTLQGTLVTTKNSLSNLKNNLEALKKSLENLSGALGNQSKTETKLDIFIKALTSDDENTSQDAIDNLADQLENGDESTYNALLDRAQKNITSVDKKERKRGFEIISLMIDTDHEKPMADALTIAKKAIELAATPADGTNLFLDLIQSGYQAAFQPALEWAQKLLTMTGQKWFSKAAYQLYEDLVEQDYQLAIDDLITKLASGDQIMGNFCIRLINTLKQKDAPLFFQTVLAKAKTLTQSPDDPERNFGTQFYFELIRKGYSDAYAPALEWAEQLLTMTGQKWYHDAAAGFFNSLVNQDYKPAFYNAITAVSSPAYIYEEQNNPTTWGDVYFNINLRVKDIIDLLTSKGYSGNHSVLEKIQEYLETPIQGSDWSYRHSTGLWLLTILLEHKFQQAYPALKDPATINAFKGLLQRGPMDIDSKIENPCIGFLHTLKDVKPEGMNAFLDAARHYIKSANQHDSSTKQWCEMILQVLNS